MSPPTRALGRGGPQVNAIALGLMNFAGAYEDKGTEEERMAFLDAAYEAGERFWDTADVYFDSEELIGKWFAKNPEKRKDIFLASKFGLDYSTGVDRVFSDPEYAKAACDRSLKKLQTDFIDLYYCHRVDPNIPIEKTVQGMVELKEQGKIHYLGLSEVSGATVRRAHAVHPISAVQTEYSLFVQDVEEPNSDLLSTCLSLGIALVAYSPLGRGYLAGNIKNAEQVKDFFRSNIPRWTGDNFPKVQEVVKELEAIGARHGGTSAQVCIAWLLAQHELVIALPGTRSVKYMKQNLEASQIKLTDEEEKEIRKAVANAAASGNRQPDMFTARLLGDTAPLTS